MTSESEGNLAKNMAKNYFQDTKRAKYRKHTDPYGGDDQN